MRFEPVVAPTAVGFQRNVHLVGSFHLFNNDLFHKFFLVCRNTEVQFIMHLKNHQIGRAHV